MGSDHLGEAAEGRLFFDQQKNHHAGQRTSVATEKDVAFPIAGGALLGIGPTEVEAKALGGLRTQGHQSFAVPFAPHPDQSQVQHQIGPLKAHHFANPQTAGIHQLQHATIALPRRQGQVHPLNHFLNFVDA